MTNAYASEAQINFAADLLAKKAWNDDAAVARKFITRTAAINIAIDWARTSPGVEVTSVATAELVGERVNQILAHVAAGGTNGADYAWAPLTGKGAIQLITWLKSLPVKSEAARQAGSVSAKAVVAAKAERVELEDGMYQFEGSIYKVQHAVHGSGNQYAKLAEITEINGECCGEVVNGKCTRCGTDELSSYSVSFSYAPGVVAKLRPEHKLSYEQAKAFGALYGTCCRCAKTLTDELSIHLGIGPVCGQREFGGEFKAVIKAAKLELKASA